jgi:hypothetical protein
MKTKFLSKGLALRLFRAQPVKYENKSIEKDHLLVTKYLFGQYRLPQPTTVYIRLPEDSQHKKTVAK